ncbi:PAS domain S-box protein [candidate division KSB1 bacterium]|nr:PAS domain S-box protein [candidate division KSB1 bacterium]
MANNPIENCIRDAIEMIHNFSMNSKKPPVRITYQNTEFSSPEFTEILQCRTYDIVIDGKKCGAVEVHFSKNRKDSTPEKQQTDFINLVVNQISNSIKLINENKRLKETAKNYKLLLDNQKDLIVEVDSQGTIFYVSPSFCEFFGKSEEKLIGTKFQPHVHAQDYAGALEAVKKLYYPPHASYNEQRVFVKGEWKWLGWIDTAVTDEQGKIKAIIGVGRDINDRKKTQEALKESEEKFRLLAENIPGAIYLCKNDDKYTTLYFNDAIKKLSGYSRQEFLSQKVNFTAIIHPDDREQVRETVNKAVKKKLSFNLIYRIIHKDGSPRWIEEFGTGLYRNGEFQYLEGFLKDITDRKNIEQEEERIKIFINKIIENIPHMIFVKDAVNLRFQFVNRAAEEMTGFSREDMIGKSDFNFFPEEQAKFFTIKDRELLQKNEVLDIPEETILTKDNKELVLHTKKIPILDHNGKPQYILVFSENITEQKKLKEAAEQTERNYNALLENIPDMAWLKDKDGHFMAVNQTFAKLYHMDPEELIGKTDYDLCRKEMAQKYIEDDLEVMQKRNKKRLEEPIEFPDGKTHWFETIKLPIYNENKEVMGTTGIARDITERREVEEKLERLNKEMLDISRQAGMAEMATEVLHNVGNVLNSVNVSSTFIMDTIENSEVVDLIEALDLIRNNNESLPEFITNDPRGKYLSKYLVEVGTHLKQEHKTLLNEGNTLIKNIDHIKKIILMQQSFTKRKPLFELQSITELVENAIKMNEATLSKYNIHVRRDFSGIPEIETDRHKVLQILINLIQNAKNAMENKTDDEKELTLKIGKAGSNKVHVSVIDNGVGISNEEMERIFSYGFTTRKKGHGFGLHSSGLVAREIGGCLKAESKGPGHGAKFILELPINRSGKKDEDPA